MTDLLLHHFTISPFAEEIRLGLFGDETTEGTLVAATRTHFSLRRVDERAGTVHVHFPRIGYVMGKV